MIWRALWRSNRTLRRQVRALRRDLAAAESTARAVQHLIRCADPAMHIRLAHQLEQAQARLAEASGSDPHRASVDPEPAS